MKIRQNEHCIINYPDKEPTKKELQERIDEAIEWVQWFRKDNKDFFKEEKLTASELDGLLKILKGE